MLASSGRLLRGKMLASSGRLEFIYKVFANSQIWGFYQVKCVIKKLEFTNRNHCLVTSNFTKIVLTDCQ